MLFNLWRRPKRTYTDPQLGTLQYGHEEWSGSVSVDGEEIFVDVAGSESAPDDGSLSQAKSILARLSEFRSAAQAFLKTRELGEWSNPRNGTLEFDGISSSVQPETFRLRFGLSNWPDASISVCFREFQPIEVELSD